MADGNSRPYGIVYLVTNTTNGKRYIGQTTMDVAIRWKTHCNSRYKSRLWHAIQKHGRGMFTIEAIASAASKLDLNALEMALIEQYGTLDRTAGYNVAPGGGGCGKRSRESIEKGAAKLRGRPLAEEVKAKLRETMQGRTQTPEHVAAMMAGKSRNKGFKHSEEAKARMSRAAFGKKMPAITDEHRAKLSAGTARYWARKKAQPAAQG